MYSLPLGGLPTEDDNVRGGLVETGTEKGGFGAFIEARVTVGL